MKSRWSSTDAAAFTTPLAQRVYSSRLLGHDASLVLHGGGNTSVKTTETTIFRESQQVIFVKGSGRDLATISEEGYTPLDLQKTARLATLPQLTDTEMVRELALTTLRPRAPAPTIEAILHALIP